MAQLANASDKQFLRSIIRVRAHSDLKIIFRCDLI